MSVYAWLAVVVFAVAAAVDIFGVKLPREWKQQRRRFWIIVIIVVGFLLGFVIGIHTN
jgi:hypothetical protein